MKSYTSIDEYIQSFPKNVQVLLRQMRKTIREAAPDAEEKISYGIPTFTHHGNLVHFGGFKDHVSFFPGAAGVAAFPREVKRFETSKGTIQFPLDKPVPLGLIKKIVRFRVKENTSKKKGVSRGRK